MGRGKGEGEEVEGERGRLGLREGEDYRCVYKGIKGEGMGFAGASRYLHQTICTRSFVINIFSFLFLHPYIFSF